MRKTMMRIALTVLALMLTGSYDISSISRTSESIRSRSFWYCSPPGSA